jgi:protein dithiol oxidoreductase (disulfide-forming)
MIKKIIALAISMTALTLSTSSMAEGFSFLAKPAAPVVSSSIVEGKDYVKVSNPNSQLDPQANHQNVVEFFGYVCAHCYDMQPMLDDFKKSHQQIDIVPIPAMFGNVWNKSAQLYYALNEIGLTPENHSKIFKIMHAERKDIIDDAQLRATELTKLGYKPQQVDQMMNSFTVQSKTQNATMLMNQYKVNGTPTFIIDNKYMTSPAMTQSYEKTIAVINYLVNKKD